MAAAHEDAGFMLFGVRLTDSATAASFRKSASMNNLSQFDQSRDAKVDTGYASDDVLHAAGRSRERKRGVLWTEDEHRLFLLGLQKIGKGDWRGIARNFVKTRTPTQVASHAQKYFLRRSNQNRRRRRSSLFDITTDSQFVDSSMEEAQETLPLHQHSLNINRIPLPSTFPVPFNSAFSLLNPKKQADNTNTPKLDRPFKPMCPIPIPPVHQSSKMAALNFDRTLSITTAAAATTTDPLPLSLKLTTPSSSSASAEPKAKAQSPPAAAAQPGFSPGCDNIISVA